MNNFFRRFLILFVLILLVAPGSIPLSFAQTDTEPLAPNARDASSESDEVTGSGVAKEDQAKAAGSQSGVVPLPTGSDVAVIRIEGLIYDFTLESIERRVDRAIQAGATIIVFDLDTPGGLLVSALDICKFIKGKIRQPTIAWINDQAYSAGILIASACDQIIMSPAATTGDCAPIIPGQNLSPTERAKALSPLLSEFQDNADDNGYNYVFFHAMCVLEVAVYEVKHKETGEIKYVNAVDYQIMVEGKTRASMASQVKQFFGAGDIAVGKPRQAVATDADRAQWLLVREVHDGSTLLTVSQRQASVLGMISAGDIRDDQDLKKYLQAGSIMRVDQTWSETLSAFLISFPVRLVLVLVMLVAIFIEMLAPGFGVAGAIALACLVGLIAPPFVVGLAEVWHLVLMAIGLGLLLLEIFVTPGFGVLGVSGIVAMFTGLVLIMVPTNGQGPVPLPAPEMIGQLQVSIMWTMAALCLACVAFVGLFKYYGKLPFLNRMVLVAGASKSDNNGKSGGAENVSDSKMASDQRMISGDDTTGGGELNVGDVGETTMELRPIGKASIRGFFVDVESTGDWIEQGAKIKVIKIRGNRIVVEPE
jgi:membrane-bound serine protease (ClpP class)